MQKKSVQCDCVVFMRCGLRRLLWTKDGPGGAHPGHVQNPQQRVYHHQQRARTQGGERAEVGALPVEQGVDCGAVVAAGAAAQVVNAREAAVGGAKQHRLVDVQNAQRVPVHQQLHQNHHRVQKVLVDVEEVHWMRALENI